MKNLVAGKTNDLLARVCFMLQVAKWVAKTIETHKQWCGSQCGHKVGCGNQKTIRQLCVSWCRSQSWLRKSKDTGVVVYSMVHGNQQERQESLTKAMDKVVDIDT